MTKMSDESVSQAEIDALVKGIMGGDAESDDSPKITVDERVIKTHMEEFVTTAAGALSDLVGFTCEGTLKETSNVTLHGVGGMVAGQVLAGSATFTHGLTGMVYYLMPTYVGLAIITQIYGGAEPAELDETALVALGDGLTQMNATGLMKLGEVLGRPVIASPVEALSIERIKELPNANFESNVTVVNFELVIGSVTGRVMAVFPQDAFQAIGQAAQMRASAKARPAGDAAASAPSAAINTSTRSQDAQTSSASTKSQSAGSGQQDGSTEIVPSNNVGYTPVSFPDLASRTRAEDIRNIDLLMDVGLQLTVELGRTRRQIRDVLSLGPGSVLELDRLAGEQVDVLVNGKLIAKAEVVVIDENYGVRITDIVSPVDRVQSLK
jgi:flagellar motor switch protein FliN/FliY